MVFERAVPVFDRVTEFFCTVYAVLLGFIIVAVCGDILLRNLGIASFPWIVEVTEYVMYGGTFLAAPWVLRIGGHVRVEILLESVSRPVARILDRIADIGGLAASAIIAFYGATSVVDAYQAGMVQFKSLVVSEWILLLPIPIGAVLLCVEFLLRLGGYRHAAVSPGDHSQQVNV